MKNNSDLHDIARKSNIDIDELKAAADSGTVDDFIDKKLSVEASAKIKSILSDKAATEKLLSTPQARELMRKILGNK